jgi:dTMP kinase
MTYGNLIVLEGTDGSGKKTQTGKLAERGRGHGHVVATCAFPRYEHPAAHLLQRYLGRNKERYARTLPAHQASLTYATDRLDWAVTEGYGLLENGTNVILDRYVLSNLAHQGARIPDTKLRRSFYDWCLTLEFGDLALPKPDLTVLLHVAAEVNIALIEKRGEAKDIHEADIAHLRAAEAAYIELAELLPSLGYKVAVVECMRDRTMSPMAIRSALAVSGLGAVLLSEDQIHHEVWKAVAPVLQTQKIAA